MLRKFLANDRPTFILRFIGVDGRQEDFFVHKSVAQASIRLRRLLESDEDHLQNVENSPAKRRKFRDDGNQVRIVDFSQELVAPYARLCQNDSDPLKQMLIHLYAHADGVDWMPSNKGAFKCPADCLLERTDATESSICTSIWNEPIAEVLVSVLALLEFFQCPPQIGRHISDALTKAVRYSNMTVHITDELHNIFLKQPQYRHLAAALHSTCRSLMCSAAPTPVPMFCLVSSAGSNVFSGLQTMAAPHRLYEYNQADNKDVAQFLDNIMCEHLISNEPMIARAHNLKHNPDRCTEYGCACSHTTESIILSKTPQGFSNFRFGLIRDMHYVEEVLGLQGEVEMIRLRSPKLFISVSISMHLDWILKIEVNCVFNGNLQYSPMVRFRVGVLNVFDSEVMVAHEADLDGSLGIVPSTQSDIVVLSTTKDEQARQRELGIQCSETSKCNRQIHQYTHKWSLNLKKLTCAQEDTWSEHVLLSPPPRIFFAQGGVTFNNTNFSPVE